MSAVAARPIADRIAGAPISWGVCEVPGWGPMLDPEVVLADMADLGIRATELGPVGYLPGDPGELDRCLGRFGLRPVAAFVPIVCDPAPTELAREQALSTAASLAAAGGEVLMVAPISDEGWSSPGLGGAAAASALRAGLEELADAVTALGVRLALHPHAGSLVERRADVDLLADAEIGWCVDTGHLAIGGVDPVELAARLGERVVHVHLKDVDAAIAREVEAGRLALIEATRAGLFRPLGNGDVDLAGLLGELDRAGYRGWLTLEQDTILETADPAIARRDAARSLEFIRSVDRRLA